MGTSKRSVLSAAILVIAWAAIGASAGEKSNAVREGDRDTTVTTVLDLEYSETAVWIRLDGPTAASPVAGAEQTAPTYYWWDYAGKTTHEEFSREATATGKRMDLVDAIEFTLASHGKLVERDSKNDDEVIGCTWATSPAPPTSASLRINHLVYGRVGNLSMKITDTGVTRPVSSSGRSRFLPNPGSVLSVFGSELYGDTYDFSMNFRAVVETTSAGTDT